MKGLHYRENNNERLYELSERENGEVELKKTCGNEKEHIYYRAVPWVCTAGEEAKKQEVSEPPTAQDEDDGDEPCRDELRRDGPAVKKLNIGLKLSLKDYISAGFHFLWQKSEPVAAVEEQNNDHTDTHK